MTGAGAAQNRRPPRLNHKKSRAGCQRCKARRVKVSRVPFFEFLLLLPWLDFTTSLSDLTRSVMS